jgi:hypothetical protein
MYSKVVTGTFLSILLIVLFRIARIGRLSSCHFYIISYVYTVYTVKLQNLLRAYVT